MSAAINIALAQLVCQVITLCHSMDPKWLMVRKLRTLIFDRSGGTKADDSTLEAGTNPSVPSESETATSTEVALAVKSLTEAVNKLRTSMEINTDAIQGVPHPNVATMTPASREDANAPPKSRSGDDCASS